MTRLGRQSLTAGALAYRAQGRAVGRSANRYTLSEASGSLGDLGTFLPITVALCVTCGLDLAVVLCGAGVMNVLSGWLFRQPVAVQPMKAIAAVAIATGTSAATVAASGLVVGAVVLALGLLGGADRLARWVPEPVVRGLQVGVGLKLAWSGAGLAWSMPAGQWAWVGAAAAGWGFGQLLDKWREIRGIGEGGGPALPWLLGLVGAGLGLGLWKVASGGGAMLGWPSVGVAWSTADWRSAVTGLAGAQLPMTLLNSVLAVCLLSRQLYPGRGVSPRRMAGAVGLMNLLAVPWGAMPMCHGAGGLAAQHACGARTGGSVVMLGGAKIALGLALGGGALAVAVAFPRGLLALLLVIAGLSLAQQGGGRLPRDSAGVAVGGGMAAAVVLGQILPAVLLLSLAARPGRREEVK